MSDRRDFLKLLLATPLVVRAGNLLAATEPIPEPPEPPVPKGDPLPEGWKRIDNDPYIDASLYRHKNGRVVSIPGIVEFQGKRNDILLYQGKQWL